MTKRTYRLLSIMTTVLGLNHGDVYGLMKSDINTIEKLKVTFSQKDTNRIAIDNSRIAQVFGIEALMSIQFDEENGHCFIKAKADPGHPVTLTLVTEEGETQDLEITFEDKPSELVMLHSLKKNCPSEEIAENTDVSEHSQAVDIIKHLVKGRVPPGYRLKSFTGHQLRRGPQGITVKIEKSVSGRGMEVLMGTVTNASNVPLKIKESTFASENDLAVYVSQWELYPQERATVMMVRKGRAS